MSKEFFVVLCLAVIIEGIAASFYFIGGYEDAKIIMMMMIAFVAGCIFARSSQKPSTAEKPADVNV